MYPPVDENLIAMSPPIELYLKVEYRATTANYQSQVYCF